MGKFRPQLIQKHFTLLELKQIKLELGKFSEDPDHYTDKSQHLTLAFDLAWKDVMIILGQTLLDTEKEEVLKEAHNFADSLHFSSSK